MLLMSVPYLILQQKKANPHLHHINTFKEKPKLNSGHRILERMKGSSNDGLQPIGGNYVVFSRVRALRKTRLNMGSVSFPVNVFCWLGWQLPSKIRPSSKRNVAACPNLGIGPEYTSVSRIKSITPRQAICPNARNTFTDSWVTNASNQGWHVSISSRVGLFWGGAQWHILVMAQLKKVQYMNH